MNIMANEIKVVLLRHGESIWNLGNKFTGWVDSDDEIVGLNIPTGFPLVYELDNELKARAHYYLGDEREIKKAAESVARQSRSKHEIKNGE